MVETKRYQPGPKPADLLPQAPDGCSWISAFWDLEDTENHTTVDFGGKHFKYKLIKNV